LFFSTPFEQQDSTLESTETSTKFEPQKCCSILKEKEANTTAKAMNVEIVFMKDECFISQSYEFLENQRENPANIIRTLTIVYCFDFLLLQKLYYEF
jgi:hypothetical protein